MNRRKRSKPQFQKSYNLGSNKNKYTEWLIIEVFAIQFLLTQFSFGYLSKILRIIFSVGKSGEKTKFCENV